MACSADATTAAGAAAIGNAASEDPEHILGDYRTFMTATPSAAARGMLPSEVSSAVQSLSEEVSPSLRAHVQHFDEELQSTTLAASKVSIMEGGSNNESGCR
jgi:hypothetical protein